jgi:hypothetical protein
MPIWLREQGYRFFIYSHDHAEPAHVHVAKGSKEGKWGLDPVKVLDEDGFSAGEQRQIRRIIEEHLAFLVERHREHFGV